jgi:Tfp pilus assembly protein PilF
VQKALQADPGFAPAHSARAWIAMAYERDYHSAADYFRQARSLAPNNSLILTNNAVLAIRLGRLEMGQHLIERSLSVDPANTVSYGNLAEILLRLGRIDEAGAAARQALDLNPANDAARSLLALVAIVDGRPSDAIDMAGAVENEAARDLILAMANHDLGRERATGEAMHLLESEHADSAAYFLAIACAWLGRNDEAFAWLERAIVEGQSYFGLKTEPFLDGLAGDPRWAAILRQAGLADDQLADIII